MEHLITMPLSEYNEIKDIKDNFQKAFNESKPIVYHATPYSNHSNWPEHKFTIVNADELAKELLNKIERLQKEINELYNEKWELQQKIYSKKSWF